MSAPPPFIADDQELPLARFTLVLRMLEAKRPFPEIAAAAGVSEARVGRIAGSQTKPARRPAIRRTRR